MQRSANFVPFASDASPRQLVATLLDLRTARDGHLTQAQRTQAQSALKTRYVAFFKQFKRQERENRKKPPPTVPSATEDEGGSEEEAEGGSDDEAEVAASRLGSPHGCSAWYHTIHRLSPRLVTSHQPSPLPG